MNFFVKLLQYASHYASMHTVNSIEEVSGRKNKTFIVFVNWIDETIAFIPDMSAAQCVQQTNCNNSRSRAIVQIHATIIVFQLHLDYVFVYCVCIIMG